MRAVVRITLGVCLSVSCVLGCRVGLCEKERPALCIQGTMTADEKPIAIVNDQIVAVGDEIEGARVVSISDSAVEFEYAGETLSLSLGEECISGSGTADRENARGYHPKVTRLLENKPPEAVKGRRRTTVMSSVVIFALLFIFLVLYAFSAFCLQKIAQRTGHDDNGWYAWVPILNLFLMVQIAEKEWWWILLMFIPYVNIVIIVILWMGISEARGKSPWLGLLIVVPIAPLFLMAYLAFSSDGETPARPTGPAAPTPPVPPDPPVPGDPTPAPPAAPYNP